MSGMDHGGSRPVLILAATICASSLAFVDGSVVNVALPAIARSLRTDAAGLQWVINAYLLPLSALLLTGGAAGDRFGRRRLLILGTVLFALTSLGCALAPGVATLLTARFLQGVSAALLMPNSLAILGASFAGEARGRAVGIWAATGAALGAAGPVLGGWLIDLGSWRSIFLINLPLAAGAIALAWRYVPPDRTQRAVPLDLAGAVLATSGLGALTWALTLASAGGGWTLPIGVLATGAVAGLGLFLGVERARGARAMMPLALFGSRAFAGLTLLTLFLYGALGVLFVMVPYFLIKGCGYSATAAGAALLPLPLLLALTSPAFGALAGRIGPRGPLVAGSLVVAAGFLLGLRIDAQARYLTAVLPALLTISLGLSAAVAPLTTAILSAVTPERTGVASGFNSAVARSGGLIATALLGSALGSSGTQLQRAFGFSLWACAAACVAAALSALVLPGPQRR
ncbi:MAG TPA: MFS transporter [Steroidobacteraceae bacterium]|nr:MFS transporter [Steroidobacteraceae bacterium]